MNYVLDSDTIIYFLKGKIEIVSKIKTINPENLFTTSINQAELFYGAHNSTKVKDNIKIINGFLANLTVLKFDSNSARIFGEIKAQLKNKGMIVADIDLCIAAITAANNMVVVTSNEKHFKKIPKCKLENWNNIIS
jgi:tRNA(fMet)-specific endonuclease VapC